MSLLKNDFQIKVRLCYFAAWAEFNKSQSACRQIWWPGKDRLICIVKHPKPNALEERLVCGRDLSFPLILHLPFSFFHFPEFLRM